MRIVHVSPLLPRKQKTTGAALAVHELATAQAREGHSVAVASPYPPAKDFDYEWIPAAFGRLPRLARWIVFPLALNLKKWQFDVAVLHGEDWFWFWRRIPTIRIMYGSAAFEARFATSNRRRYSQLLLAQFEKLARHLATITLEITEQPGSSLVLPLGFDAERFMPGPKSSQPTLLFVGTWGGRKRGSLAYSIFEELAETRPDLKIVMVTDDSPTGLEAEIIPFASDEELASLYRSSWVLLHPSLYEGFGLPYLEAMASGTAVVSSPNPGAAMLLRPGGQTISEDEELLAAVAALLDDDDRRARQAARGHEFARNQTWSESAAELSRWCAQVVTRVRRPNSTTAARQ